MLTVALPHLLSRGVRLDTQEAVALARELLAHPCGVPTAENIRLGSDGSASCISTDGMPSVASVATLLLTLLPDGARVPAPLRYALARALETVEAPRFASLDEFSTALARFETGASRDVLRGLLQRGAHASRPIAAPVTVAPAPVATPAPPPMFRSFDADRQAGSPVYSWGRWILGAAVALALSFAAGYAVMDGLIDRRAPTPTRGNVAVKEEIVRIPPSPAPRPDVPTKAHRLRP